MEGGFVLFAVSSYPVLRRGQKLPPERGWWSPNFWGPWYRVRWFLGAGGCQGHGGTSREAEASEI